MHPVLKPAMRILLFLCLLAAASLKAQTAFYTADSAFIRFIDLPSTEPFDSTKPYNRVKEEMIYILSPNDLYRYFGYNTYIKHYRNNFSQQHILGRLQCRQCVEICMHKEGQRECHRNRCRYTWVWTLRDNAIAFTNLPSATWPGHSDALALTGRKTFLHDTVITKATGTGKWNAKWYTTGGGDCHARFTYSILKDNYYPSVILKEENYYGGCRAGGRWEFTICFNKPEDALYIYKRTILLDDKRPY